MRTELEEQKVFPMKAHLHHIKEHTGTMALNFSTDASLFFMQVMEEQPESLQGPRWTKGHCSPADTAGTPIVLALD